MATKSRMNPSTAPRARPIGTARRLTARYQLDCPFIDRLPGAMTEYAGVVRDEIGLRAGINEIASIGDSLGDIGVHPDIAGYQELAHAFDLKSSLLAARATLDAALERRETRGCHNRSDFPDLDESLKGQLRVVGAGPGGVRTTTRHSRRDLRVHPRCFRGGQARRIALGTTRNTCKQALVATAGGAGWREPRAWQRRIRPVRPSMQAVIRPPPDAIRSDHRVRRTPRRLPRPPPHSAHRDDRHFPSRVGLAEDTR